MIACILMISPGEMLVNLDHPPSLHRKQTRLNQALYYLDFCWIMNFAGIFIIGLLVFTGMLGSDEDRVSTAARRVFFNGTIFTEE
jgi:hypothetical protein